MEVTRDDILKIGWNNFKKATDQILALKQNKSWKVDFNYITTEAKVIVVFLVKAGLLHIETLTSFVQSWCPHLQQLLNLDMEYGPFIAQFEAIPLI